MGRARRRLRRARAGDERSPDPARAVVPGLPGRVHGAVSRSQPSAQATGVRPRARVLPERDDARGPAAGGGRASVRGLEAPLLPHAPRDRRRPAAGRDGVGRDRHVEGGDARPARSADALARVRGTARRHARRGRVAGARRTRRRAPVDPDLRLAVRARRSRRRPLRGDRRLVRRLLGDEARLHPPRAARLRGQLGRRRPHHIHARVAAAVAKRLVLPDGPDGRARADLRRRDVRGLRVALPRAVAARPGTARPAVGAAAPGQRPRRRPELDRRHLSQPRPRRPEGGARVRRRSHGRGPGGADDRRLGGAAAGRPSCR